MNGGPGAETTSLRATLEQAEWGPRDLTRAVNAWLSTRGRASERIDATAAYPWVRLNYCPDNGIAAVVATVLTERLGRYVSAEALWPDHPRARRVTTRMRSCGDQNIDEIVRSLDLLAAGARPPALTSAELTVAAIAGLREPIAPPAGVRGRDRVQLAQAELIAGHVAALRKLDDCQGGGALSLRYVSRELGSVLDLIRCGSYEPDVGDILLTSVADLTQLAGWMQFDSGATDIAQRYLQLGIRVARAAGDKDRAMNNAGMLAYIAAEAGEGVNSLAIMDAAAQLPTTSRLLRARLAGRHATAHAAVGDLHAFRAASENAQELLAASHRDHTQSYLYYLTPAQLDAEAGYSLVALAQRTDRHRSRLLMQASQLLAPRAQMDGDQSYQRSAVLHGCQLTHVHLMLRDYDGAVAAARGAAALLPSVQSGRCVAKLRTLHKAFARRRRSAVVAEFLPDLEETLQACT
ncbi:hypothetical protein ACQP1G_38005 [Nocardia sp. CA-107356]|uniref:hypothetical protein n=1 Tax=Nocardia sp. CA-107356 TaxID=3239972 RepID=UPI003D8CBDCC